MYSVTALVVGLVIVDYIVFTRRQKIILEITGQQQVMLSGPVVVVFCVFCFKKVRSQRKGPMRYPYFALSFVNQYRYTGISDRYVLLKVPVLWKIKNAGFHNRFRIHVGFDERPQVKIQIPYP